MELNYFKHIELIEAGSAQLLVSKLRAIKVTYQLNQMYSDGKNHYAVINAAKRLSVSQKDALAKMK